MCHSESTLKTFPKKVHFYIYKPVRIVRWFSGNPMLIYLLLSQPGLFWKKSATVQERGHFKKVSQSQFCNFRYFKLVGFSIGISIGTKLQRLMQIPVQFQLQSNLAIRNGLIRNKMVLMNHFCRVVQKPTFLSNSKIDGSHKIFSLSMSKALEKSVFFRKLMHF